MFIFILWVISILAVAVIAEQKKLNVGGYLVLAIFTGPLAVMIVLLMAPKTIYGAPVRNLDEAKKQLEQVRYSLYALELRIKDLENLVHRLSQDPQAPATVNPPPIEPSVAAKPVEPVLHVSPSKEGQDAKDMELDFGRNWLNKIGMVVLALGVAFLISYTFKYFGPLLKIIFGYGLATALFILGLKLEVKEKFINYGRGLLGGAWAIVYFTTYAMYHFDASRIIHSDVLDFILLALVVTGMIIHTLKYKSESMMSVTLLVAYLTLTVGSISSFTILSSLLLGVFVLVLVYQLQWIKTFILSVLMTYFIHYLWVFPNLSASRGCAMVFGFPTTDYYQLMNFIFLSCYALLFFIGIHLASRTQDQKTDNALSAINFGNISLYSILSYPSILELFYPQRFKIVLGIGLLYLAAAMVMKKWGREKLFLSDIVAAIFIITFSMTLKFLPTSSLLIWLVEMPCLLFIGFVYKEIIYRYLSYGLAVLIAFRILFLNFSGTMEAIPFLGFYWTWLTFMSFWATIASGICFYLMQRAKIESLTNDTEIFFDQFLSFISCAYLTLWLTSLVQHPWEALTLMMEGIGLLLIGMVTSLKRFRSYAYIIFAYAAICFVFETDDITTSAWKWFIASFNTLVFFAVYYVMKFFTRTKKLDTIFENEEMLAYWAGIILLIFSIHNYVFPHWISLSLGASSAALIVLGMVDGGKSERLGGLGLLALTLARVVFIDLSGLDIVFKIITFIILGVLLLGISYIYNKFELDKDKKP